MTHLPLNPVPCGRCGNTGPIVAELETTSVFCLGCDTRGPEAPSYGEAVALWNEEQGRVTTEAARSAEGA